MPNGTQAQAEEEEGSGGESQEEWESDVDEGDEDAGSDEEEEDEEEEEEVEPPCSERRSKLAHDPAADRGKGVAPAGQSTKRPRTTLPASTEKASKQARRPRQNRRKPYRR